MSSTPTAEERAKLAFPAPIITGTGYKNMRIGYATCIREEVEPLEAENVKLRALVQELVNDTKALRIEFGRRTGTSTQIGAATLMRAASQGFTPTNTTER